MLQNRWIHLITCKSILPLSIITSLLSACGGGGNKVDQPSSAENNLPSANAGPDQVIRSNETIMLNGTASDLDGRIESIQWLKPNNSEIELKRTNSLNAELTAHEVNEETHVTLQLKVTDNQGGESSDEVMITIQPSYKLPHADAGPDVTVLIGKTYTLDGSDSFDSDGAIPSYIWTLNGSIVSTSATFTQTANTAGKFHYSLEVVDTMGARATDQVIVSVVDDKVTTNDNVNITLVQREDLTDNRTCENTLSVRRSDYQNAITQNAFYEDQMERKTEQRIVENEKLEVLKNNILALNTSINNEELELASANIELDELIAIRDEALQILSECIENNGRENCETQSTSYIEKRDATRNYRKEVVETLETSIVLNKTSLEIKTREKDSQETVVKELDDFFDLANTAKQNLSDKTDELLKSYGERGENWQLEINGSVSNNNRDISQARIVLLGREESISHFQPAGILDNFSDIDLPEIGHAKKLWDSNWFWLTEPEIINNSINNFLQSTAFSIEIDLLFSCFVEENNNDLINTLQDRLFLALTNTQSIDIENTYDLTINLSSVLSSLKQQSTISGYLSKNKFSELLESDIEGINIEIIESFNENEIEDVNRAIKTATITQVLNTYAIPTLVNKSNIADCNTNSSLCNYDGWWLEDADSPVNTLSGNINIDEREQTIKNKIHIKNLEFVPITLENNQ